MFVKNCPICGRQPKIRECHGYKDGTRRRLCGCPNYCSTIPYKDHLYRPWIIFEGEGDDNAIYRAWNDTVELYEYDKSLDSFADWDKWKYYAEEE